MLVNPLFLHEDPVEHRLMTPYFPLGLLYLAATAQEAGYRVSLFDSMFQAGDDAFVTALERDKPRIVGISVLATVRAAALRLAEIAHRFGAIVIVGGADPTGRPESYVNHQSNGQHPIDIAVVGEGEQTLLELLPLLLDGSTAVGRLGGVNGLVYLDADRQIVTTPARIHCNDLESIPFPARDLLDIEAYRQAWQSRHGPSGRAPPNRWPRRCSS
jgi:radical SAM superfamily enzyme YgiQ (UPF0313 family)